MRVLIASSFVPFTHGGDMVMVRSLKAALAARGFDVDTVLIPLVSDWRDLPAQTVGMRLFDLSESCGERVDRLITTRYPAYALPHPDKRAWFIHHHRGAYDLWGTEYGDVPDSPGGLDFCRKIRKADNAYLRECRKVFTNSGTVADRLRRYNDLEPDGVLFPPLPEGHGMRPGETGDYLFYPSRVTTIKRQELAIRAMAKTRTPVKLVIGGKPDSPERRREIDALVAELGVGDRVTIRDWLTEREKADLMADALGSMYLAYDEDSYGYVTLEAFHAAKPVVTLRDSGGSLEVIESGRNGYVCTPDAEELADAFDRLYDDRENARRMGQEAHETLARHRIDWDHVIERLVA